MSVHTRPPRPIIRLSLTMGLLLTTLLVALSPRSVLAATCTVTNTNNSGAGSLRAALGNTNGFTNCSAITFRAGLTGTITLASDLPTLRRTVSVAGPGAADLTIDRNSNVEEVAYAFRVDAGGDLTLTGLTVTGGAGAVYLADNSRATVTNSTFLRNKVGLHFVRGGSATVTTSTFLRNGDGLLFYQGGSVTVTNSTFSGNQTALRFGESSYVTVINSTLSDNRYGLIFGQGGSAKLVNTLLAKGDNANCSFVGSGTLVYFTHNLADDASCFANGKNDSRVRTTAQLGLAPGEPADNGGPTKTIALLAGSAALEAGDDASCEVTGVGMVNKQDQRGISRPQGARCDIGAFERVGATLPTQSSCTAGARTFPLVPGRCVAGRFLDYWDAHGGLTINGFPLTNEFEERLEDGQPYRVQYFERVRMEYHPEAPDPYKVQLGQFGRRILQADLGREADPPAPQLPGLAYDPVTGHNFDPRFLPYWQQNGGLAQFGRPLTETIRQVLEDGTEYEAQYFERARFEWHSEQRDPQYLVQLGQFGRRILNSKYPDWEAEFP